MISDMVSHVRKLPLDLGLRLEQHLDADLACCDLAQRDDGWFVAVGVEQRLGPGTDLASSIVMRAIVPSGQVSRASSPL
jgi:hypothetical protein